MKIKNLEEALKIFEENAIQQEIATSEGDYKTGNKCYDKIIKVVTYLKESENMNKLLPYFHHSSENVRIWATSYFLDDYQEAVGILEEIANGNSPNSLVAKTSLKEWEKGNLKQ